MAGEHLRTNEAEMRYKVYVEVKLPVDILGRMLPTSFKS